MPGEKVVNKQFISQKKTGTPEAQDVRMRHKDSQPSALTSMPLDKVKHHTN